MQVRVRNRVDSSSHYITYHTTMHGLCESSAVFSFASKVLSFLQAARRASPLHYNIEASVRSVDLSDIDRSKPYGVQPFTLVLSGTHATFGLTLEAGTHPYLYEPNKMLDPRLELRTQYLTSSGLKYPFPSKGIVTLQEVSNTLLPLNVLQGTDVYVYILNWRFSTSGLSSYQVVLPFMQKGRLEFLSVSSFTLTQKTNPFGFNHRHKWKLR